MCETSKKPACSPERRLELGAEQLEIAQGPEPHQRVARLAQPPQTVIDVEETGLLADALVLGADRFVQDGHFPSGEIDESGAVLFVKMMKRGSFQ